MSVRKLEYPITLTARVVTGFGRGGKQLGCPTANMCAEDLGSALDEVETGIYCGWATIEGRNDGPYKAVGSIGYNPYYNNKEKTVEPHLIHDFDGDFYDSKLKFVITGYLRPEENYPSLEALVDAIQNDINQSKEWLDTTEGQEFKIQ